MDIEGFVDPAASDAPRLAAEAPPAAIEPESPMFVNLRKILATTRRAYGLMPGAPAGMPVPLKKPSKAWRRAR
jgi:hypothetical protein